MENLNIACGCDLLVKDTVLDQEPEQEKCNMLGSFTYPKEKLTGDSINTQMAYFISTLLLALG